MSEKNKLSFEKLTPIDESNIDVYESAIDFAFQNDDVLNVAISGAYGAGKSSVLASYKKMHPEKNFIHISLAHFSTEHQAGNKSIDESKLEGKILNQLIHQIPPEKIAQTNFRIKKGYSTSKMIWTTIGFIAFCLSLLHIVNFKSWQEFVFTLPLGFINPFLKLSAHSDSRLITGCLAIVLFAAFVFSTLKYQKDKNVLKRLSIQGNEIEIFEDSNDSFFDKYLNEVLYLFENLDADVVVFEDVDRFEKHQIFERLREINILANQQRDKEFQPKLRFFYLLKDDIFDSKDRTKFFDFIIPVVPVLDGSNSYDQFIVHLQKNGIFDKFDKTFLQGISLYVDDMRLLKNICNEFLVYYNRLKKTEPDCNKMFALIVYKNLFPKDYCELQLNRGFVFSVFQQKGKLIEKEKERIEKEIKQLEEDIDDVKKEHLKSRTELDLIYENKKRGYYYSSLSPEDQTQYDKRIKTLENKLNRGIDTMTKDLSLLKNQMAVLNAQPLSAVLTRENESLAFSGATNHEKYNEIQMSEYFNLLKYLLRNGYIDESYPDYMTYFYENSLSRIDKIFLRAVTDRKAKDYSYNLKSPEMVYSRLRNVDFDQEEVLNFDLFNYLLEHQRNSDQLIRFIEQLKQKKAYSFVADFYKQVFDKGVLVQVLNSLWSSLIWELNSNSQMTNEDIMEFSLLTLYFSSDKDIDAVNKDDALTQYISSSTDYLQILHPQIDVLIRQFIRLNVSFASLSCNATNDTFFAQIYEKGLYDLTFENIKVLLRYAYCIDSDDKICHKNYSLIMSKPDSPLYEKIHSDMNEYMAIMLDNCESEICDDEGAIQAILNNDQIDEEFKRRYISYLTAKLTELSTIKDTTLWQDLIQSNTVQVTGNNIMTYFVLSHKMDDILAEYINRSQAEFCFAEDDRFKDDDYEKLFDEIIPCPHINDYVYRRIIKALNYPYENLGVLNIPQSKLQILIDMNIVQMNQETLLFMRKHYRDDVLSLIRSNIHDYNKIMTSSIFSHDELMAILEWDVDEEIKINLLKYDSTAIPTSGKGYSLSIRLYILQNNLEEDDMLDLFHAYEACESEIQKVVEQYAYTHIHTVIDECTMLSSRLIDRILCAAEVNSEDKATLISKYIPTRSKDRVLQMINIAGFAKFDQVFDLTKHPRFTNDKGNVILLNAFQVNGWIDSFDETSNGQYTIRRQKSNHS